MVEFSFGMNIAKGVMYCLNFLFLVAGIGIIAVCAVIISGGSYYAKVLEEGEFKAAPVVVIIGGLIIIGMSILCFYATAKEKYQLLYLFAGFLIVVFILEMAGGITAITYRKEIGREMMDKFKGLMVKYRPENPAVQDFMDGLQRDFKCCGAENYTNWRRMKAWHLEHPEDLPDSCCMFEFEMCGVEKRESALGISKQGCVSKFKKFVQEQVLLIAGLGIGIGLSQLMGIAVGTVLGQAIKKKEKCLEV